MNGYALNRRGFLGSAVLGGSALALASSVGSLAYAQPNDGTTLVLGLATNPTTFDPINQPNHDAMVLGQTIFENLVECDVDGNLRPQLAKELPIISDDGRRYLFELRDDVLFHNGQPMTAEDVKYSFDYMLNPANKASRRGVFARIESVNVLGPTQVEVNLVEPYHPWLWFLTKYMGIYPAGSREQYGPDHFKLSPTGVGTGVGLFEEWVSGSHVSFTRNPNYWRKGLPHWERLLVKILPEDAARTAFLLSGEIDITSASTPQDFFQLSQRPGLVGQSRPSLGTWFTLFCNNQKSPFDDVNFRRAVSCAIDRKTIADNVYQGLLEPSAVPAARSAWWFDSQADEDVDYDPEKVRALLAASKYPNGASFDLDVPATSYLLDVKDAALLMQAQLAEFGISFNLKPVELSVLFGDMIEGKHTAALVVMTSPGEPTFLIQTTMTSGQSLSKSSNYQSPKLDELLRQAFAETEEDKLKPIYADMQRLIAQDMPHVWVGFVNASNLWRDRVKNFKVNQGITMTVQEVQI